MMRALNATLFVLLLLPLQGCSDLRKAAEPGSKEAADALTYFCAF
jgi:hypothetical protein